PAGARAKPAWARRARTRPAPRTAPRSAAGRRRGPGAGSRAHTPLGEQAREVGAHLGLVVREGGARVEHAEAVARGAHEQALAVAREHERVLVDRARAARADARERI